MCTFVGIAHTIQDVILFKFILWVIVQGILLSTLFHIPDSRSC